MIDRMAREEGRSVARTGKMNLEVLRQCRERKEKSVLRPEVLFSSLLCPDGRPFLHKVERKTFEELIAEFVARNGGPTEKMLHRHGVKGTEIETVVLVVAPRACRWSPRCSRISCPSRPLKWQHQDVAVALGAAYHAQCSGRRNKNRPPRRGRK